MKKILALSLLSLLTIGANAWERKPMDSDRCQRDGKTMQRCQKENDDDNEYIFTSLLSPQAYKLYNDFTPEQKKMAMDNADRNRMDPNSAVSKVATQAGAY
jgi:hypothetical protein